MGDSAQRLTDFYIFIITSFYLINLYQNYRAKPDNDHLRLNVKHLTLSYTVLL